VYIRAVRFGAWRKLQAGDAGVVDEAANDLVRTGSMVSVYECHSTSDIELVAVAHSCTRLRAQPFDYIEIDDFFVANYPVATTPGTTPLPDANRLHRDVDLSGIRARDAAIRLAFVGFTLSRLPAPELRVVAARLRDTGQPIPASSWLLAGV